jgi:hypothetical protein
MYESTITVAELIRLIDEQISNNYSPAIKVSWINELEQELYSDLIEDYAAELKTVTTASTDVPIELTYLFEDIRKVEVKHGTGKYDEYSPTSLAYIPDYSFYNDDGKLNYSDPKNGDTVRIISRRLPTMKIVDDISDDFLCLPDRFIKIYKYYIFSQILQLKKEYEESSNWMNLYNSEIEDFRNWYYEHKPAYGG